MMGPRQEAQPALFYEFSLEDQVPQDHLLRSIDRFVDLSSIRAYLAGFYSHTGCPSIDPELLIRIVRSVSAFSARGRGFTACVIEASFSVRRDQPQTVSSQVRKSVSDSAVMLTNTCRCAR